MNKLEGVIFDLDGTLVHSEDNYYLADKTFVEKHGGKYEEADREKYTGLGAKPFVELIKKELGLPMSVSQLLKEKDGLYLDMARGNTHAFPEMVKLLKALRIQRIPMGIASGSSLYVIEETLKMAGIRGYFSALVSSESVGQPKPAPDVFLEAARTLKLRPQGLLVFEDSGFGIEAAKAAGMACVAVPFIHSEAAKASYQKANLLIEEGMSEFRAEDILQWIDENYCQCDDCTLYDLGRCAD